MVEAVLGDLADEAAQLFSLRILQANGPKPIRFIPHQEIARSILIDEMVRMERVDEKTAVNGRVAVRLALDIVSVRPFKAGTDEVVRRLQRPISSGGETNLPHAVAIVKAGHGHADAAGSLELRFQVGVERISAHGRRRKRSRARGTARR